VTTENNSNVGRQAAGLRHVEVIHGDETFYPQPMKDYGQFFCLLKVRLHKRRSLQKTQTTIDKTSNLFSLFSTCLDS